MFYKAMQKKKNNKKAFTLIELIVVIAIIGVLIAILVPTMSGMVGQARTQTAIANARTVYSVGQAEIAFATTSSGAAPSETDLIAAINAQLANLDGTYTVVYVPATGALTSVTFTNNDGGTGSYPNTTTTP